MWDMEFENNQSIENIFKNNSYGWIWDKIGKDLCSD